MNIFQPVTKILIDASGAIGSAASQVGQAVVGTAVGVGGAIDSAASQVGQAVVGTAVGVGGAIDSAASQVGQAVMGTAVGVGQAIGNTASLAGQAVVGTAVGVGGAIDSAASQVGQAVVGTAVGVGGAIDSAASQVGQAVVGTAVGVGGAIANTASLAGQAVVGTAVGAGEAIGSAAAQATKAVGYALTVVGNNPQFQQVAQYLQVDWLVRLIDQVDLVSAEEAVRKLQQHHPNEQPREIAHRLMVDQALRAGGTGLVSNLVPGSAVALQAVDLSATMLLQAEMIYQIACAYGLDLQNPARKGEVLAIFGLSLGSNQLLNIGISYVAKAGLSFVPAAGAVISASTNAIMIYALGHGACWFYETNLNTVPLLQCTNSCSL